MVDYNGKEQQQITSAISEKIDKYLVRYKLTRIMRLCLILTVYVYIILTVYVYILYILLFSIYVDCDELFQ